MPKFIVEATVSGKAHWKILAETTEEAIELAKAFAFLCDDTCDRHVELTDYCAIPEEDDEKREP